MAKITLAARTDARRRRALASRIGGDGSSSWMRSRTQLAAGVRWLGYWGNSYYDTDPDEHTKSHLARIFASWTFGTEPTR